jgi:flagellar protein FliS
MQNSRKNPWQSYSKVATQTATPEQLVLMLYDGTVRFLERALAGFQLEDLIEHHQAINNNILRAQAIIQELDSTLNMEKGGEISANFRRLYDYMNRRLHEANVKKDKAPVEEILMRVRVLRDSWAEMMQKRPAGNADASPLNLESLQAA